MPAATTKPAKSKPQAQTGAADRAALRAGRNGQPDAAWMKQHESNIALAKKGNIDVYFEGDASTERWTGLGNDVWTKEFAGWKAANFAVAGDKTQHVLWRLENGELDGVKPKVFVLMIGANNQGQNTPEEAAAGVAAIVHTIQDKDPQARVLLLGILPRKGPVSAARKANDAANALLAKIDHVTYLDIGPRFVNADGTLRQDLIDKEQTYLTEKGYQVWADAIKPVVAQLLTQAKSF